ncbi:MAG: CPBP family intramembrane metalloprotease [Planctomycetales bacterium]|nr:CPBP family intramembrane metalloprotease [Planctomycetales bacterium]
MDRPDQIVLLVIAGFIVLASLGLWLKAAYQIWHREPLLAAVSRRPVPWTILELLLIGLLGFITLQVAYIVAQHSFGLPTNLSDLEAMSPRQQITMTATFGIASLLTWVLAMLICRGVAKASWSDLGLATPNLTHDLKIGLAGFAMLSVPMLSLHMLLHLMFQGSEQHPFIELLMKDPQIGFLLPIAFVAIFVAPLMEETFFRLILQGWLERVIAAWERQTLRPDLAQVPPARQLLEAHPDITLSPEPSESPPDTLIEQGSFSTGVERIPRTDDLNPYRSPLEASPVAIAAESCDASDLDETCGVGGLGLPTTRRGRWVPIGISATLFALAHVGQGPAPIPLFLLAVGLGYIYQRTHRILPCILIHFLVNLTAMVQLALEVWHHQ